MTSVEAFDYTGREGVTLVKEGGSSRLELRFKEGMFFNKGYISPHFVTDRERMEAVVDDPYILIVNYRLSASKDVLPLLQNAPPLGKPLAIIAWGVEGEALASLVDGKVRGVLQSAAVEAPGSGNYRRALLEDIAALTGAQVIRDEADLKLAITTGVAPGGVFGRARRVIVTKDETTIVDGGGDADQIVGRINQIRDEIEITGCDRALENLQKRLANLAGGVAVITVKAATEAERQQRKQRAEAAILTTRGAIESGLLPGGGAALVDIQRRLQAPPRTRNRLASIADQATSDEAAGMATVLDSLAEPLKQIAANAGHYDPAGLADSIRSSKPGTGFDVITNSRRDMPTAGIIDTFLVTSHAVTNAAKLTQRLLLLG